MLQISLASQCARMTQKRFTSTYEQLQLDSNIMLEGNTELKEKVISLCHKYKNLWSHFEGRKPYGATKGLELKIDIVNPHTPPVKQRPRVLNELQQRSLQSQILDWEAAGKVKQYKVAPANSWISNFHPVPKPQTNSAPVLRWTGD